MSNENKKVIDMTSENENNEANTSNELNELRESNANLIAERETLKGQVMAVEKKLAESQAGYDRVSRYWREAEDKLKTVCAALEVVDPSEYMTGRDFIKKIAGI